VVSTVGVLMTDPPDGTTFNVKETTMTSRMCRDAWRVGVVCAVAAATLPGLVDAQQRFTEWVEMGDGVLLATEVWLPEGEGPWPVVLTRTPYGRSDPITFDDVPATDLGFACVVQEMRGTHDSQGEFRGYADDGPDGRTTVTWIAAQPWCNDGAIGMDGCSASGTAQYAVAPGAPAVLDCLAPGASSPDQYHHLIYQGGCLREELVRGWTSNQNLPHLYDELKQHRLRDDWWEPLDWTSAPETVTTPAFHYGGWFDFAQQGALDAFVLYQHRGGDGASGRQYLLMGPWSHATVGSGRNTDSARLYPANASVNVGELNLQWQRTWLKGEPTGVDQWPPVRVYLMGADQTGAAGNVWVNLDDWPPAAQIVRMFLDADGGLTRAAPPGGSLVLTIDPEHPVPTYGGANLFQASGSKDQRRVEERDDVLVFTSEPFARPLTVMGRVTARVWIRPDTPDLDLSVRLTDVYPDGRSLLIVDGIQRARMRCGDDVECLLEPGVAAEIEVDLWSTAMVFDTGHRIRVAIAGSNSPRFEVNPCDGGDLNAGTPTVAHPEILFGVDFPSAILLPCVNVAPRHPGGRVGEAPPVHRLVDDVPARPGDAGM
jgi:hypothetical protein